MATRLSLSVNKQVPQVPQVTNVSRFVLDAAKITGLVQFDNGLVLVTFTARNGQTVASYVNESFETISDAIELADYEHAVALGLVDTE